MLPTKKIISLDPRFVKKVLILEDDDKRIQMFEEWLVGINNIEIYRTSDLAIKALKKNKYDIIFLDHDLAGDDTGFEAAKIIPKTDNRSTTVIIHSLNPAGAQRMWLEIGMLATRLDFGDFVINVQEDEEIPNR